MNLHPPTSKFAFQLLQRAAVIHLQVPLVDLEWQAR